MTTPFSKCNNTFGISVEVQWKKTLGKTKYAKLMHWKMKGTRDGLIRPPSMFSVNRLTSTFRPKILTCLKTVQHLTRCLQEGNTETHYTLGMRAHVWSVFRNASGPNWHNFAGHSVDLGKPWLLNMDRTGKKINQFLSSCGEHEIWATKELIAPLVKSPN